MGGLVCVGGNANTDDKGMGRFFEPTIIANANSGMRVQYEQFFGPIVTFQEVEDEKQALELINSTKYGLNSSLFTRNQ
jgi:acyl-CoA reductase-like NAD-dependent aldehyde dehydrogenase